MRAGAFCVGVALTPLSLAVVEAAEPSGQSLPRAPTYAPVTDDWTGFYVGGHLGYAAAPFQLVPVSGRAGLRPAYPGRAKQRHCAQGRHIAEFIPHACTTWLTHKNDAYLLHVYRGRLEYPELPRKVIGLATEHPAITLLIDNSRQGKHVLPEVTAA